MKVLFPLPRYDSSSNSKKAVVIGVSVAAAVLFAVLAMALFYVFIYRPWKQRKGRATEKDQTVSLPIYPAGILCFDILSSFVCFWECWMKEKRTKVTY
jgi:uncharacterized membrane protein YedE/YeeE